MRLLVTGGLGFIGSNFINYWLENYPEDSIVNLDKVTYAADMANISHHHNAENYRLVKGDIQDERLVENLAFDADVIVNFAAESHVDNSIDNPKAFIETNILGVYSILEASRKHDVRIHHISTDEVFGSLNYGDMGQFDENSCYKPRNPYSASKASGDHIIKAYVNTYGVKATISNCSNNYGPNQHPEKLIPKTILKALKGERIPIYGNGENIRDWIYVGDHCRAIETILSNGRIGETYLIGVRNEVTNIELVKNILENLGLKEDLIEYVEDRKGHDLRYSINPGKIEKELGWKGKFSFSEGLDRTINFYKQNSERYAGR